MPTRLETRFLGIKIGSRPVQEDEKFISPDKVMQYQVLEGEIRPSMIFSGGTIWHFTKRPSLETEDVRSIVPGISKRLISS